MNIPYLKLKHRVYQQPILWIKRRIASKFRLSAEDISRREGVSIREKQRPAMHHERDTGKQHDNRYQFQPCGNRLFNIACFGDVVQGKVLKKFVGLESLIGGMLPEPAGCCLNYRTDFRNSVQPILVRIRLIEKFLLPVARSAVNLLNR